MTPGIGYMRCSGLGQDSGDTWNRQEDAIANYALAHDIEIVDWFRDTGVSGKTELENRPGLAAALERIENNGVKLMVCESADRLARDAMVSEIIVRQFQKSGGVIVTASGVNLTEGDDSNPTAALIRGVLALIAEFDRRVIVLKLRAARDRMRKREGKCEGRKAFGTTGESERQIVLELIARRRIGMTCAQMAADLNLRGIPTRQGKKWHPGTVAKILARQNVTTPTTTTTEGTETHGN